MRRATLSLFLGVAACGGGPGGDGQAALSATPLPGAAPNAVGADYPGPRALPRATASPVPNDPTAPSPSGPRPRPSAAPSAGDPP
ncbi:MAG: hypothetical protein IT373_08890 [Polyangiaceae bacterium]|nr:hypothetical protein [Polyangiaceae bacterium]